MRILVAEDEKNLNKVLKKQLESQGYSVDACLDGLEAKDCMEMAEYDVVILDIMMPGMDGLSLLKWARERELTSQIIMLTARDSIEDRVKGLDMGADDYLTKPFAFEELLARIRMLVRKKTGNKTNVYKAADLEMDTSAMTVTRAGKQIMLTAREFAVLRYLLANKGIVLSREKIEEHLFDYDYEGASNVVDVYIRYLRKKVDEGFDVKLIHTVRGMGYVLKEDSADS
jgi:DNA-binding response OmpR family regulator